MPHLPRTATALLTVLPAVALVTALTAPAAATTNASGTFFYTDLVGGNQQIQNPPIGQCHLVSTLGTSADNRTDATAVLYTDTSCALLANPVPSGSTVTFLFKSFRFTTP
ncbi:hypothetical protein [Nonomuraea candida]|uniref:hypothetical protein n=1 Tax=Nonomuraea candida TaxID=359159 RepID=UPI0005BA08CA|nr:hypothetical protein [Nonomuraea candida]